LRFVNTITTLCNDVVQSPVTYYFRSKNEHQHLPAVLPYIKNLADRAAQRDIDPAVRIAGTMLECVLADYLVHIGETFLGVTGKSPEAVIIAYLGNHRHQPISPVASIEKKEAA
jgi:hypothetical protein